MVFGCCADLLVDHATELDWKVEKAEGFGLIGHGS
jgi:hypothetical protein